MIWHVILTSLRQEENGYSFPDHILNGSGYFEEVGWVLD